MGFSTSKADEDGVENGETLALVLVVLPIVQDCSKRMGKKMNKDDKRFGYLGNIQTSAGILVTHLKGITEAGKSESFRTKIACLADYLENIFSDGIIKFAKLQVSNGSIQNSMELMRD